MRSGFPLGATITADQLKRDPHPVLATLREGEPISWVPVLGGWLVTRYDLALVVMRDARTFTVQDERFSTARVTGPSMLSLDGAEHARHRRPFVAPFRPGPVRERFREATAALCAELVDELRPLGTCELRAAFAAPLASRVLAEALGLPVAEAPQLVAWYREIVASVDAITAGGGPSPSAAAAYAELTGRLLALLERGCPDPSASILAAAAADGALDRHELIANAAILLFGGIETIEAAILNAMLHLLENREALDAVRGPDAARPRVEPELLTRAVEESLRLEPAASMIDRYATADVRLAGAAIRAGELVHVSLAGAGRDPAVFPEPERMRLDPPRPRGHLAFAQGPHVCLGVHLARLEVRTALLALLERLPGLRLAAPARPSGLVFRKPRELHVAWD